MASILRGDDLLEKIEELKESGANILLPSTRLEGLSAFHAPVLDQVYLSPDPNFGDVYPEGDNYFRIARQGLMKLSVCAGIMWHPHETRRTDNRQDRDYVSFQAVGGIRKADGTPVFFKAEYDMDFEVIEEELRELFTAKCRSWNKSEDEKAAYIESSVRRDLLFKRKHKMKLAESGAMTRVIRALLGLKNHYTRKELEQPFVMVRIVIRPDYDDEQVKKRMIDASIQAMTGVYGDGNYSFDTALPPPIDLPHEEAIRELPETPEDGQTHERDNGSPEFAPEDFPQQDSKLTDFVISDRENQEATIKELAKKKGYNSMGKIKAFYKEITGKEAPSQMAQFTSADMTSLFSSLSSIPNDDIPW